jgi:hypothetical protein
MLLALLVLAPWSERKLTASDGLAYDHFGQAVALRADRLLIGGRGHDSARGKAYVYRRQGQSWVYETAWTSPDPEPGEQFGNAVALDGDFAFVGCRLDDEGAPASGAVYVFQRFDSGWRHVAKLKPTPSLAGQQFGRSIAARNGELLIGAVGEGGWAGAAYRFRLEGDRWRQHARLAAPDPRPWDQFGTAVSLGPSRALIGAPGRSDNAGEAFVFDAESRLEAVLAPEGGFAGSGVALLGDRALIGVPNSLGTRGRVAVFVRDAEGWTPADSLLDPAPASGDRLGTTVAADDRIAIAAGPGRMDGGGRAVAWSLASFTWSVGRPVEPRDRHPGQGFGRFLAVDRGRAAIGAFHDSERALEAGAVYIYEPPLAPTFGLPAR